MSNSEWKPNQQKFGPKYKLIGKDYPTPDLYAKVTGKAKYAEDFRIDGMLFCKLLLSPVAHGRVKHLDVSKASRFWLWRRSTNTRQQRQLRRLILSLSLFHSQSIHSIHFVPVDQTRAC